MEGLQDNCLTERLKSSDRSLYLHQNMQKELIRKVFLILVNLNNTFKVFKYLLNTNCENRICVQNTRLCT